MKILKNLSLFFAAAFLLLHSFIPHFHHNSEKYGTHVLLTEGHRPNDFFHLIQEVLSITDPGQNHLEDYSLSDNISIDFFPLLDEAFSIELISNDYNHSIPVLSFSALLSVHSTGKRGPPLSFLDTPAL